MHLRKISRWSVSFLILGLYSALLVFSDTRGTESRAYAQDVPPAIERLLEKDTPSRRRTIVLLIRRILMQLPPLPHDPHVS